MASVQSVERFLRSKRANSAKILLIVGTHGSCVRSICLLNRGVCEKSPCHLCIFRQGSRPLVPCAIKLYRTHVKIKENSRLNDVENVELCVTAGDFCEKRSDIAKITCRRRKLPTLYDVEDVELKRQAPSHKIILSPLCLLIV